MPLLPKLVTHQESKPYVNSEMTGYESTTSRIVLSLIFQEHNSLGRRPHDQSKKKNVKKRWNLPGSILNQGWTCPSQQQRWGSLSV
jgi:hypothetical protein